MQRYQAGAVRTAAGPDDVPGPAPDAAGQEIERTAAYDIAAYREATEGDATPADPGPGDEPSPSAVRTVRTVRRRRRRRRLSVVAAVTGLLLLAGVGLAVLTGGEPAPQEPAVAPKFPPFPEDLQVPEPTPSTVPPTDGPVAPGVRWPSGSNANPPWDIRAWEATVGRPTDVAVVFTTRDSWQNIVFDDWPMSGFRPETYSGMLSVAQPLFPRSGDEGSCARGDYDAYWAGFGQTMIRNGRPAAIVRLGWEFNGNWFWWHPRDTETWKACYQRIVTQIRSTAPAARIEFNVSAHRDRMPNGDDVWAAYPGDGYVDIVSSDAYDSFPPSLTPEIFEEQCNLPSGACTVARFAREHGKRFAVAEWGLVRADENGGGDNPLFVEKMHELFERNRDILVYEAYFNAAEPRNVRSSLFDPPMNPVGAQKYLELFGAGAAATVS